MRTPKLRLKLLAAGSSVLLTAAGLTYLLNTEPNHSAATSSSQDGVSETAAEVSEVPTPVKDEALAKTPSPTGAGVQAPVKTQTGGAGLLAYRFKGAAQGQPLARMAPAVSEGAEKGRVVEMERLSVSEMGNWTAGQTVRLATPDGELSGLVNLVQADGTGWVRVGGSLQGRAGSFTLAAGPSTSGGLLMLPSTGKAFEVVTEQDGRVLMVERRLADKRCFTNEVGAMRPFSQMATAATTAMAPPLLSSRPTAPAVIYMDFDGETVTDPAWNNGVTIVALAPSLTNVEIEQIYLRVKEDFAPFNVDVTTDKTRYNAVPPNRRTRCIVTPTNTAAPGSGGVAYIGAFNSAGTSFSNDVPCWVFNGGIVGAAEAITHEVGHTMGLLHDGRTSPSEGYYAGQGTGATSWAPIMGVGYYVNVSQWSKGEYLNANNKEDDLAIITQFANGVAYVADEAGTSAATAAPLMVTSGSINQTGLITGATDSDFFQFTSTGGAVVITASPAAVSPNLDILLELRNGAGTLVTATSATTNPANPVDGLAATLSATLTAGSYTVKVAGTSKGSATVDGYSAYGSLGAYTLTGTISGVSQVPSITSSALSSSKVGSAYSYQITATNTPTGYALSGALPAGVTFTAASGLISGTATAAGTFPLILTARNGSGSGSSFTMTLTVSPAVLLLADAIDLQGYTVTNGGTAPWLAQEAATAGAMTFDNVDSAASGKITHGQTSSMSISVVGPKKLGFRWKVSSEAGKDLLSLVVDGVVVESISGETSWVSKSVSLTPGTHSVEWRYSKDSSMSAGLDTGWVDNVSVVAPDALSLSGSFNFGKVGIGSSGTSNLTISNNSTAAISVTGITYPVGFSGAYNGTISAGSSKVVSVSFTPTAESAYAGNLTVASNAPTGDLSLPVSGEGVVAVVGLVSNVPVSPLGAPTGSSRTYKISVPAGSTSLKVVTSGGTGDADLYIKRGVTPSPSDIDFLSEAAGNAESISVPSPVAGDWYILLYGYEEYAGVSLTATVTAPPSSLSIVLTSAGNGTVTGGGSYASGSTVVANATPSAGYVFEKWVEGGSIQSTSASYSFTVTKARTLTAYFNNVTLLTNNVSVSNLSGAAGSQKLYKITVPPNTGLLSIRSSGGTGDVDLYLKRESAPTTTAFHYRSAVLGNAEGFAVMNPVAGDWYVMVRGFKAYTKVAIKAVLTAKTSALTETANATALKRMAGGYDGLLGDGAVRLLGRMEVQLTSGGAFSCRALLDGVAYSLTGRLDSDGRWMGSIRVGGVPMAVGLAADLAGEQIIKGSVGWDGIQYEVLAMKQTVGAPDQAGTYPVTLWPNADDTGATLPPENGSGVLSVKKDGTATLSGVLGDGTYVTAKGHLSTDGKWALYAPLYARKGAIGGWWVFEPWKTSQRVKGSLRWIKAADDAASEYKDGFNGLVTGEGAMLSP